MTGLIGTGNIPTGGGTNDNALYLQHCGGEGIIFLSGSSQDNQTTSTERMRITHTGNVGIGTNDPSNKLTVYNNGLTSCFKTASDGWSSYIGFKNDPANKTAYMGMDGIGLCDFERGALLMGTWTNNSIIFVAGNATEKMRIKSNGNVGIGTTNPNSKLDVRGSVYIEGNNTNTGVLHVHDNNSHGEPIARFTANGDGFILIENTKSSTDYDECGVVIKGSSVGGYWLVGTDDTSALEIKYDASDVNFSGGYGLSVATNGYVGIGTNNPTYKLDVNGSFRSTSFRCNDTNVSETTFSRINSLFDRYHYRYYNQSFNSISYDSTESTNRGTINYYPIWRGSTTKYAVIDLILQTKGYWGSLWHHSSWTGRYVRARLKATYNTYANPHRWEYYVESQLDLTGRGTTWNAANLRIDFLAGNSLTINVHDDGGLAGYIGWSLIELKT